MDIAKPFSQKPLTFAINLAIWLFSCFVLLAYRSLTLGTSLIAPLSQNDKDALAKMFDSTILLALLGGCSIVFLVTSFIAYKVGTQKTAGRMRSILDRISGETGSVLLNNGSLLVAIAYFTGQSVYALGGIAAWLGWWVFEPTQARAIVDRARLRLHVYADNRVPEALTMENIFRWYYLRQRLVTVTPEGKEIAAFPMTTLFVTFEPEVQISTLKVRSPDIKLPAHEVKEFNQRFAIIAFMGEMTAGTLEVSVEP